MIEIKHEDLSNNVSLDSQGIHLLMDDINVNSCAKVVEWILKENFQPKRRPYLTLIINSPGGSLDAGFAVIDMMLGSAIPVRTVGLGQIASAGFMIFITGEKGNRVLTPNTSILSHQYSWGSSGKEHELFAAVKEFELTSKRIINHYKRCTGLNERQIRQTLLPEKDIWLSAQEAKDLNACDQIRLLRGNQR